MQIQKNYYSVENNTTVSFSMSQAKCLIFFAMLYISIMICNAILTNKWIGLGNNFVFGGAFISPMLFILGDIIAEIFGYKIAKNIILIAFICQTIFATLIVIVLSTPAPPGWHEHHSFSFVLGSILRIDMSGLVAYLISGIVNVHLITKWKVLLCGRVFWLRSLGASTISEALYSGIAILMIGFGSLPFFSMLHVIMLTYLIKLSYSILCAYPGNMLASYIKKSFKLDMYDFNKRFSLVF
jgi:hypothetical protein